MSNPKISVVVCTYNRASLLEDCIESLVNQDLEKSLYEIIVVDNASTDDTQNILAKFGEIDNFRTVYEPLAGLSKARNTGWRNANGAVIGYLDDDARASSQWLREALWSFENLEPSPDVVTGPIKLFGPAKLPEWIDRDLKVPLGYLDWGSEPFLFEYSDHKIVGANCFFTCDSLRRMGGFREDLGRKKKLLLSGEEIYLQKEIESGGGYSWYHPSVQVEHFVPEERIKPSWFYKRYYWGGVSDYVMFSDSGEEGGTQGGNNHTTKEPGAVDDQSGIKKTDQIRRLIYNGINSFGILNSRTTAIRSRIYMSYVVGYLAGFFYKRAAS